MGDLLRRLFSKFTKKAEMLLNDDHLFGEAVKFEVKSTYQTIHFDLEINLYIDVNFSIYICQNNW